MILLDKHVLVWLSLEPERLPVKARHAIREARGVDGIAIAAITLWGVAELIACGLIRVAVSIDAFVRASAAAVTVLPITPDIAVNSVQMPENFPKDPADRLIAATAIVEGVPLLTADGPIRTSGVVQTIW